MEKKKGTACENLARFFLVKEYLLYFFLRLDDIFSWHREKNIRRGKFSRKYVRIILQSLLKIIVAIIFEHRAN